MGCQSQAHCQCCKHGQQYDFASGHQSHNPMSRSQSSSSSTCGPSIFCYCGKKSIRITSNTRVNPGRPFFRCPLWRNKTLSCGYFQWEDELESSSNFLDDNTNISQLRRRIVSNERELERLKLLCVVLAIVAIFFLFLSLLLAVKWSSLVLSLKWSIVVGIMYSWKGFGGGCEGDEWLVLVGLLVTCVSCLFCLLLVKATQQLCISSHYEMNVVKAPFVLLS